MAKWASMYNKSLLLSSMRSLVQVMLLTFLSCFDFDVSLLILIPVLQLMQKCQIGMERMEAAEARAASWVAEREDLQAERALEAKDELLREEVSKNAGLAVDLEHTQAEVARLREEAAQNAHLSTDLDGARAALVRMEKDLLSSRGLSKRQLALLYQL
eukprot:TRINITY_DN41438_c0_g1_i1.p1 TRINITY_DN41438_c0_g1~~TRINITY_DN41438_c0_g1_i1.p1  ORF type:complete len:168 (+),score=28.40 TRINITY_DN41438_c0_g1_i1:32-505(+)